jgi:hypothetical protein
LGRTEKNEKNGKGKVGTIETARTALKFGIHFCYRGDVS